MVRPKRRCSVVSVNASALNTTGHMCPNQRHDISEISSGIDSGYSSGWNSVTDCSKKERLSGSTELPSGNVPRASRVLSTRCAAQLRREPQAGAEIFYYRPIWAVFQLPARLADSRGSCFPCCEHLAIISIRLKPQAFFNPRVNRYPSPLCQMLSRLPTSLCTAITLITRSANGVDSIDTFRYCPASL